MKPISILTTLLTLLLLACSSNQLENSQVQNNAKQTPKISLNKLEVTDSISILEKLFSNKKLDEFILNQNLPFSQSYDTIINDERGIKIGNRINYQQSYIQWMDSAIITIASIKNKEIKMYNGIEIGMSFQAFSEAIKLNDNNFRFDTLSFVVPFLNNRTEFIFSNNQLKEIYCENLPD